MTTEEKARAYAEKLPVTAATWGMRKSVIADAYLAGATEALASQWVSVEDGLPETDEYVLIRKGAFMALAYYHDRGIFITDIDGKAVIATHFMPIPSLNPKQR